MVESGGPTPDVVLVAGSPSREERVLNSITEQKTSPAPQVPRSSGQIISELKIHAQVTRPGIRSPGPQIEFPSKKYLLRSSSPGAQVPRSKCPSGPQVPRGPQGPQVEFPRLQAQVPRSPGRISEQKYSGPGPQVPKVPRSNFRAKNILQVQVPRPPPQVVRSPG